MVIMGLTQSVQKLLHNAMVLNLEGFEAGNKYSETVLCMLDSSSCNIFVPDKSALEIIIGK